MKSPFYFIVKPVDGKRYSNEKKINGIDFIVNSSEEDHRFSNREAVVVELPNNYTGKVSIGDTLLVHHNVFKIYNDMRGRRRSGRSFISDGLFFVDGEQFFMYKNEDGWHTHDRYCFVEPAKKVDSILHKGVKNEPLMGIMRYTNDYLESKGVLVGDEIYFSPGSEYEFMVDGIIMYRIFDHQIVMKL